jgi:hypothetical protein
MNNSGKDAFQPRPQYFVGEMGTRMERVPPKMKCVLFLWIGISIAATAQTNPPLAAILSELTKPTKQIPFKQVIEATTHHRILDFDTNNAAHVELRKKILVAAKLAGERAHKEGIATARANEAGNHIEPFVKAALREVGLHAQTPTNALGKTQTTGYPDIEIAGQPPCYVELKTYNAATADTTQRTFYYSPSEQLKVTHDALHLLLAFQLEKVERDGKTVFIPVRWKLISLQDLQVHLKFEFNQNNRGLYGKEASASLLGEGEAK